MEFVLSLGFSLSLDLRRSSFGFRVGFSAGFGKSGKDRESYDDLVELWEEGLIDF
ncbi:MAG: hypothetical protein ABGX27_04985 [Desulfurobacteriaceae bacterium]